MNYRGFDINTVSVDPPWGPTEEQAWKDDIDTLVMDTVTQAKATGGHHHYKLYSEATDNTVVQINNKNHIGINRSPSSSWVDVFNSLIEFDGTYNFAFSVEGNVFQQTCNAYYYGGSGWKYETQNPSFLISMTGSSYDIYKAPQGPAGTEITYYNYLDIQEELIELNQSNRNVSLNMRSENYDYAFNVHGVYGHIGVGRIAHSEWHSNYATIEIGAESDSTPFHGALYQIKNNIEIGLVNAAAVYSQTNNRWEASVDNTTPVRMALTPSAYGIYTSDATIDVGDPITWSELFRVQDGLFLNYANDVVHQRKTNDTNPLKLYLGHVRFSSGTAQAGQNNDGISEIYFEGRNDAGSPEIIYYSKIISKILSAADGSEAGFFSIENMDNGTSYPVITALGKKIGINKAADLNELLTLHDGVFDFSASNIDHGMTTIVPTNIYGQIGYFNIGNGGLQIRGLSDADASALILEATIGHVNPTDSVAAMYFNVRKKAPVGVQNLDSSETAYSFTNDTAALFTILGSGALYAPHLKTPVSEHNISDGYLRCDINTGEIYPHTVA